MSFIRERKDESFKQGQRFLLDKRMIRDSLVSFTLSNSNLALLHFGNVIVRRDYTNYEFVKIISGGPSGHEPAHAGYVGKGMLTAAIHGDVFVSPPASEILRVIREVTFKQKVAGTLLIIPYNVGTSLNFGVAAQKATNEGIRLKYISVKDDVSHPTGNGLTGSLLVQKIAGALAESGAALNNIYDICKRVSDDLYSVILTLKPCKSPKLETCICIRHFGPHDFEIGGGLQDEMASVRMNINTVEEVCQLLLKELTTNPNKCIEFTPSMVVVVLINNLGNTSIIEQQLFVKCFVQLLQSKDVKIARLYFGHYMTCLDMAGFTVTILNVTDTTYLELLDAPTDAPNWHQPKTLELNSEFGNIINARVRDRRPILVKGPMLNQKQANTLLLVLQFACDALISCETQMNLIDCVSGDGDTGTRIRCGIQAIYKEIDQKMIDFEHPFNFLIRLSQILENSIAGTLGCIYCIFFEAAANHFFDIDSGEIVTPNMWMDAFANGVESMRCLLNVEPGGRSMLDPLYAGVTVVNKNFEEEIDLITSLDNGLRAAEDAVQNTKISGRKYPDPGAHAVGIWLRAVFEGIKLKCS